MRPWQEEVLTIGTLLTDNWDDELLRGNFVDLVLQLAVEQPLKTPFVAAVVLVANANNGELVPMLLKKLASGVEEKLGAGAWRDVKLYLKLLACLQSCLEGDGLFPILEDLFARAAELQTASSEDVSFGTRLLFDGGPTLPRRKTMLTNRADGRDGTGQDHPPHPSLHHVDGAG